MIQSLGSQIVDKNSYLILYKFPSCLIFQFGNFFFFFEVEHTSQKVWVNSAAEYKAFNIQEMHMGSLGTTEMYGYLKPQEGQENACTPIYTLARKIYKVCSLTVFHSSESRESNGLSELLLMQSRSI